MTTLIFAGQPACLGRTRLSCTSFHTVQAFHVSNEPRPPRQHKPYVCPSGNRSKFRKSLAASGVVLEEATEGIPLIFQDVKKALRPLPPKQDAFKYDKDKIDNLLRGFAIKGNESTFTHAIINELLPTIQLILGDQEARAHDDVVLDGFWKDQPSLDPDVTPPLSLPKTDLLQGFRGKLFDKYPLARQDLDFHMRPIGLRSGLTFPLFSLEAKNCHGSPEVAQLQNQNAAALMLRNWWRLVERSHIHCDTPPSSRASQLAVLSSVLTPSDCSLDFHWVVPSGSKPEYRWRRLALWRFPDQFVDASRGLINAVDWVKGNLEKTLYKDLDRLERHLDRQPETGSSSPEYGPMSARKTRPGHIDIMHPGRRVHKLRHSKLGGLYDPNFVTQRELEAEASVR